MNRAAVSRRACRRSGWHQRARYQHGRRPVRRATWAETALRFCPVNQCQSSLQARLPLRTSWIRVIAARCRSDHNRGRIVRWRSVGRSSRGAYSQASCHTRCSGRTWISRAAVIGSAAIRRAVVISAPAIRGAIASPRCPIRRITVRTYRRSAAIWTAHGPAAHRTAICGAAISPLN